MFSCSELMSWVNDMKALLSADELAKDMSGAEAMLQRHRERKGEIDAQEDSFKAATQFGQTLISSGHFASEEVRKEVSVIIHSLKIYGELYSHTSIIIHATTRQLQSLSSEKAQLRSLWEERKDQFEQCLDLQLFMRDADQADNWMAKQEVSLS